MSNSIFKNNIFLQYGGGFFASSKSLFENNIFLLTVNSIAGISYSEVSNNLFVENLAPPSYYGCWGLNKMGYVIITRDFV